MIRLSRRLPYFETLSLEMYLAISSCLWGLWLLLPFDVFESSRGFTFVASLADEWVIGIITLTVGLSKIATAIHGRFTSVTAVIAAAWWAFIATGLAITNPLATGVVQYGAISLANLFVAWRSVARDA